MSGTGEPLDDSARPRAPKIEDVTLQQRRHGQRLALIHEMHLQQIAEVRRLIEQAAAGDQAASAVGEAVSSIRMLHNYRRVGTLCGYECAVLTSHHTIEDQAIFPALSGRSDGLQRVIDRLRVEHEVIHGLLEELEAAGRALDDAPGPEAFARVRETFERLERTVRSHFGYEQKELEEALGYWQVPI